MPHWALCLVLYRTQSSAKRLTVEFMLFGIQMESMETNLTGVMDINFIDHVDTCDQIKNQYQFRFMANNMLYQIDLSHVMICACHSKRLLVVCVNNKCPGCPVCLYSQHWVIIVHMYSL